MRLNFLNSLFCSQKGRRRQEEEVPVDAASVLIYIISPLPPPPSSVSCSLHWWCLGRVFGVIRISGGGVRVCMRVLSLSTNICTGVLWCFLSLLPPSPLVSVRACYYVVYVYESAYFHSRQFIFLSVWKDVCGRPNNPHACPTTPSPPWFSLAS